MGRRAAAATASPPRSTWTRAPSPRSPSPVRSPPGRPRTLSNTATIMRPNDVVDPDATNNSATDTTTIDHPPAVTLAGPTDVDESSSAERTYTFSVADPDPGSSFTVVGLPACGVGGVYVSGSLTTDASGGSFRCVFADGPASPTVFIQVEDDTGLERRRQPRSHRGERAADRLGDQRRSDRRGLLGDRHRDGERSRRPVRRARLRVRLQRRRRLRRRPGRRPSGRRERELHLRDRRARTRSTSGYAMATVARPPRPRTSPWATWPPRPPPTPTTSTRTRPLDVDAPGVLGNDDDRPDDPLTAQLVSTTCHGLLSLSADGSFLYTAGARLHRSRHIYLPRLRRRGSVLAARDRDDHHRSRQ